MFKLMHGVFLPVFVTVTFHVATGVLLKVYDSILWIFVSKTTVLVCHRTVKRIAGDISCPSCYFILFEERPHSVLRKEQAKVHYVIGMINPYCTF
jgi:hypothetical protein